MTDTANKSARIEATQGFIVVAVLWILTALSALVLIYLNFVTNSGFIVADSNDRLQANELAVAAVELTAYQLGSAREDARPTSGTFDVSIGAARLTVTFHSEAARVDLNAAPKPLLAGLFIGLGASQTAADSYAERIIAWRLPTDLADSDPETSSYRVAGLAYGPRHAPFPQPEELWLVRGIPPLFVERVMPLITTFSNIGAVNVRDASPQVLAALPGMSPDKLQNILNRRSADGQQAQSLLSAAGGGDTATIAGSNAYRLSISIVLKNDRQTATEVVIFLLDDGDEPYRVLSWRHPFDGRLDR